MSSQRFHFAVMHIANAFCSQHGRFRIGRPFSRHNDNDGDLNSVVNFTLRRAAILKTSVASRRLNVVGGPQAPCAQLAVRPVVVVPTYESVGDRRARKNYRRSRPASWGRPWRRRRRRRGSKIRRLDRAGAPGAAELAANYADIARVRVQSPPTRGRWRQKIGSGRAGGRQLMERRERADRCGGVDRGGGSMNERFSSSWAIAPPSSPPPSIHRFCRRNNERTMTTSSRCIYITAGRSVQLRFGASR